MQIKSFQTVYSERCAVLASPLSWVLGRQSHTCSVSPLRTGSLFVVVLWVSWVKTSLPFRNRAFSSAWLGNLKIWDTRCGIQTFHTLWRSWQLRFSFCMAFAIMGFMLSASTFLVCLSVSTFLLVQYVRVTVPQLASGFFIDNCSICICKLWIYEKKSSGFTYINILVDFPKKNNQDISKT